MPVFQPAVSVERGVHVLSFRHETQAADLDQLRHYFTTHFLRETAEIERLAIDLSGIMTLDSSCLALLVQRLRRAKDNPGWALVLCAVDSRALAEVLTLTRFDKVFPMYPTREAAVDALAS